MRKKTIVFFIVFVLMLCIFAACKKDEVNGIVIVDNNGTTRVLATNDNGETMTDDAGNLIVVVTDAEGKSETQRVAPPAYYADGDTIQTLKYSLTVPKGWSYKSVGNNLKLTNTDTNSELNLVTMEGKTLEDAIASADQTMELFKKEGTVEVSQTVICGVDATKYTITKADSSGTVIFYIFEKNGTVYSFYSVVVQAYKDSIDFETIINSIKFK